MLTPAWTTLRYHPQHAALWRSVAQFAAVAAGRGSGKSELARRRIVRFLPVQKPWADPMYFYALPTMDQARRVAWKKIKQLIPKHWLAKEPNESRMMIETVFGSTLYVLGMDKPQRIEGDQWDGCVVDESSDQKPSAFNLSILPALSHRAGWCWRIGVPKRYGIGAADFKDFFDKGKAGKEGIESYSWPSSDILTPEQMQWAMDNLSSADLEEQYGASWLTAGGCIFSDYDDTLNVRDDIVYHPDLPILVGSDFNVDPMAWVLAQEVNGELHVFDEIWLRNTTTRDTLNLLALAHGERHKAGWYFYGDASSKARKTSAAQTDFTQIVNDQRFTNKRVLYPRANPSRADRFASMNALFKTANGVRRCFIHPKCKRTRQDCKERAYIEGTREPNDSGDIGHITDALGYLIYGRYPLRPIVDYSELQHVSIG